MDLFHLPRLHLLVRRRWVAVLQLLLPPSSLHAEEEDGALISGPPSSCEIGPFDIIFLRRQKLLTTSYRSGREGRWLLFT